MKVLRASIAALAVLTGVLVLRPDVSAQQTESRILGTLKDESAAALPGVTIDVKSRDNGYSRSVVSDGNGSYVVTNLSPGTYVLDFQLAGFAPQTGVDEGIAMTADWARDIGLVA